VVGFDKYTRFYDEVFDSRGWEKTKENQHVYPYRYGSYYFFEANNKTKQFKVASFLNITSRDVTNYYSHYLYDAIIKAASGRPDLNFTTTNIPQPTKN